MMLWTEHNKKQIAKLLLDYLLWKFDNLSQLNQYNTDKNKKWLWKNLTEEQVKVWLWENEEIINISEEQENDEVNESEENLKLRIFHHFEVSIKKIEEINKLWFDFNTDFEKEWDLLKSFNTEIKRKEWEIKAKNWGENLFKDLKL
jgi:hypothetical protein